jgi:hypothetical protein
MATSNQGALLDQLEIDVKEWLTVEKTRIKNEVKFLKAVLEGTTGSSKVRRKNVELSKSFLVEEIDSFLSDVPGKTEDR